MELIADTTDPSIGQLAFSPDGQWLAMASFAKRVRLVPLGGGKEKSAAVSSGSGARLAFSPDGSALAVADGALTLFDVPTMKKRWSEKAFASLVEFRDDGARLLVGSGGFRLYDTRTGQNLPGTEHTSPVLGTALCDLAFSTDGALVHSAVMHKIETHDTTTFAQVRESEIVRTELRSMRRSPDGALLVVGTNTRPAREDPWVGAVPEQRHVLVLRAADLSLVHRLPVGVEPPLVWETPGHYHATGDGFVLVRWVPGSRRVAAVYRYAAPDNRCYLHVWDVDSGASLRAETLPFTTVRGFAISPDGRRAAFSGSRGVVLLPL
ncbi:MAG: WD40 repeat domain-containing protein [Sandaracinaceae bacterium]|nr:WD40 repeat domain-containing protein [Sandaracinaceae bacterium]